MRIAEDIMPVRSNQLPDRNNIQTGIKTAQQIKTASPVKDSRIKINQINQTTSTAAAANVTLK